VTGADLLARADEHALVALLEGEVHGLRREVAQAVGEVAAPERQDPLLLGHPDECVHHALVLRPVRCLALHLCGTARRARVQASPVCGRICAGHAGEARNEEAQGAFLLLRQNLCGAPAQFHITTRRLGGAESRVANARARLRKRTRRIAYRAIWASTAQSPQAGRH